MRSVHVLVLLVGILVTTLPLDSKATQRSNSEEIYPLQYCQMREGLHGFKSLAYDRLNLMAFANGGGILNLGTCWWHSRLQQSAIYLARFNPRKPKPDASQAGKLVSLVMTLRAVVEIPGYQNWYEFSRDWSALIQKKLNAWQLNEGIFGFAWINGLSGASQLPSHKLREKIQQFKDETEVFGRIAFAKLQLPGIEAHSLLVVAVNPIRNGFEIEVIDSNYPREVRKTYFVDTMKTYQGGVPYLERRKDFFLITSAMNRYCSPPSGPKTWMDRLPDLTEDQLDQLILEDLEEHYQEAQYTN